MKHAGSCGGVYVAALAEVVDQMFVAADVGHDAQLDLRVVGREEYAARFGHKGFAYFAAVVAAHRYVLQVGIG